MPSNRTSCEDAAGSGPVGRVLLTRPGNKNSDLAAGLLALGIPSLSCPLLDIVACESAPLLSMLQQLSPRDIVIAVSETAVVYARRRFQGVWRTDLQYYAVGETTAAAMSDAGMTAVLSPTDPRTEGLLQMPGLQSLDGRRVLILRGEGGRETLAEQLSVRGARVSYCELYRRQPAALDGMRQVKKWQAKDIQTIIVTSGEILLNLLILVPNSEQAWLHRCRLIVPSARVAQLATQSGWSNVIQAPGAANRAIIETIKQLQSRAHG